jgi:hypothetical protein
MVDYLILITVALALILPYVTGTMLHHFLVRHWEKAIGWILLFTFCLTTGMATLVISAVEPGEFDPTIPFLNIAPWVMLAQAMLWGLFRFMNQRRRGSGRWRTVALTACLVSLTVGLLVPVTYNAVHQQRIAQDLDLLNEVGYIPYPGAVYPDGDGEYEHKGGPGFGHLIVHFLTDDDPDQVFDFYAQCAEDVGLRVRRGTSNRQGTNVLWAVGNETTAMEVEQKESPDEWTFNVYFGIYSSFEEDYIEENYDLDP